MYDPRIVQPMREELTSIGIQELKTPEEVDQVLKQNTDTLLLVINSVCGCAAGAARPAVKLALQHAKKPKKAVTVFAGQDKEATARAREYLLGFPPSSPSFALLKGGKVVKMIHRHEIEGFSAQEIAQKLTNDFEQYC